MSDPPTQVPYVEIPASQVPEDHMLCLVRDLICASLGLPAIRIKYFRPAETPLERGQATLSNLARALGLHDQITGFSNDERLAGLTISADDQTVWVRWEPWKPPESRILTVAHELRHQQQFHMFRTRTAPRMEEISRQLREHPEAVKQWMEADAERFASETMRRLERNEPPQLKQGNGDI